VSFENIIVETLPGGVGLIRLNRPTVLNALNTATMAELVAAFDAFAASSEVRTRRRCRYQRDGRPHQRRHDHRYALRQLATPA
jgi:hypothetical protein